MGGQVCALATGACWWLVPSAQSHTWSGQLSAAACCSLATSHPHFTTLHSQTAGCCLPPQPVS